MEGKIDKKKYKKNKKDDLGDAYPIEAFVRGLQFYGEPFRIFEY